MQQSAIQPHLTLRLTLSLHRALPPRPTPALPFHARAQHRTWRVMRIASRRPHPYAYPVRSSRSLRKSCIAFSNPSPQRNLHLSLRTLHNRPSTHPLTFQLPTNSCARPLYSYTPRSIIILISPAMLSLLRISLQVMLSRPLLSHTPGVLHLSVTSHFPSQLHTHYTLPHPIRFLYRSRLPLLRKFLFAPLALAMSRVAAMLS